MYVLCDYNDSIEKWFAEKSLKKYFRIKFGAVIKVFTFSRLKYLIILMLQSCTQMVFFIRNILLHELEHYIVYFLSEK